MGRCSSAAGRGWDARGCAAVPRVALLPSSSLQLFVPTGPSAFKKSLTPEVRLRPRGELLRDGSERPIPDLEMRRGRERGGQGQHGSERSLWVSPTAPLCWD